jgi:hypothetical protein
MRKTIIAPATETKPTPGRQWLDLESLAEVEITSEDPQHPVESALIPGEGSGWRAGGPGEQTIRLVFSEPQVISRVYLDFVETTRDRTQEYVLRWSADDGKSFQDVVRQQWNFSPSGANRQTEDHRVELNGVTVLELTIIPEIGGGDALASLAQLRLG